MIVVALASLRNIKDKDFLKLGGTAAGKLGAGKEAATIIAELPERRHEARSGRRGRRRRAAAGI